MAVKRLPLYAKHPKKRITKEQKQETTAIKQCIIFKQTDVVRIRFHDSEKKPAPMNRLLNFMGIDV